MLKYRRESMIICLSTNMPWNESLNATSNRRLLSHCVLCFGYQSLLIFSCYTAGTQRCPPSVQQDGPSVHSSPCLPSGQHPIAMPKQTLQPGVVHRAVSFQQSTPSSPAFLAVLPWPLLFTPAGICLSASRTRTRPHRRRRRPLRAPP